MIIVYILFAILIIALSLWAISNFIAVAGGSPAVNTPLPLAKEILSLAKISKKDIVYDLGCGSGNFLVSAAEDFGAKAIGYEISPYWFILTKLRSYRYHRHFKVNFASMYEANINEATIIVIYLLPKTLISLFNKLKNETRPGTIIVSRGFPLPGWQPIKKMTVGKVKTRVFIYQVH